MVKKKKFQLTRKRRELPQSNEGHLLKKKKNTKTQPISNLMVKKKMIYLKIRNKIRQTAFSTSIQRHLRGNSKHRKVQK